MRSLGQYSAAKDQTAVEPLVLLEVTWGGLNLEKYGDRDYSDYHGSILSFSGITSRKNVSNSATTGSCSFVLSDHEGDLQNIVNDYDLEGSLVNIYYYFAGSPGTKTLIFKGNVSDPINWDEGERTLSFEVESIITSDDIGYATQEGDFNANYAIGYGKVWPTVFGTCAHVPAVLVQAIPESKTTKPISFADSVRYGGLYTQLGVNDPDTFEQITTTLISSLLETPVVNNTLHIMDLNAIWVEDGSKFPQNVAIKLEIDGVIFDGSFNGGNAFAVTEANSVKWENVAVTTRPTTDGDYQNPKVLWLDSAGGNIDLANHHIWFARNGQVRNPETGQMVTLSGWYENVCVRQEGLKCWFKYPFQLGTLGGFASDKSGNWICAENTNLDNVKTLPMWGLKIDVQEFIKDMREKLTQRTKNAAASDNPDASQFGPLLRQLDLLRYIKNAFWSKTAGVVVRQWNPTAGDIYVANSVESTEVLAVYGIRTIDGKDHFEPIPELYYTLRLADATELTTGPAIVTSLEFTRPLDSFREQGWKREKIWVSLTSSLTNNSATLIKNVLDTYTTLTTDATSFELAAIAVEDYPANFALLKKKDALTFAKEVAWQSRCALITDGSDIKINYLSIEPTAISGFTFDEATTKIETVIYGFTDTNDLATVLKAKWNRTYAPTPFDEERIYQWENYIDIWGVREKDVDMYIYNDENLIAETISFWGNRLCRIWRRVKGVTFTDAMMLEVFDCVSIGFSVISPGVSKGIIDSISHNYHDSTITLDVWLPVEQGTQTQNDYAWLVDDPPSITSPTAGLSVCKASIMLYRNDLDLDEIYREIRKLENEAVHLAKVTRLDVNNRSRLWVRYHANGPFEAATSPEKECWNHLPFHNLKIGDWVQIRTGQDGINYPEPYIFPPVLGMVIASNDDGEYQVRVLEIIDTPTAEALEIPEVETPTWATNYNSDSEAIYGSEEIVTAVNVAQMHLPVGLKAVVANGRYVVLRHFASYKNVDNDPGWWWFDVPLRAEGISFDFETVHTVKIPASVDDGEEIIAEVDLRGALLLITRSWYKVPSTFDPGTGNWVPGGGGTAELFVREIPNGFSDDMTITWCLDGLIEIRIDHVTGYPKWVMLANSAEDLYATTLIRASKVWPAAIMEAS